MGYSLYRGDVSETNVGLHVLFEAVGLPEQFDVLSLRNQSENETVRAKKQFLGGGGVVGGGKS